MFLKFTAVRTLKFANVELGDHSVFKNLMPDLAGVIVDLL